MSDSDTLVMSLGMIGIVFGLIGMVIPYASDYDIYGKLQVGNLANRPAIAIQDQWYYANDTNEMFYYNQSAWYEVPLGGGGCSDYDIYGKVLTGLIASRPVAGINDRWFYANDTESMFYDYGGAWYIIKHVNDTTFNAHTSNAMAHHGDWGHYGLMQYGLNISLPAAGIQYRWWYSNDTNQLFYEDGSSWHRINWYNSTTDSLAHRPYNIVDEPSWIRTYALPRGQWTKVQSGKVLDVGASGKFDDNKIDNPSVLLIDGIYKMWYTGHDGATKRIGLAHSTDRVTWVRQNDGDCVLDLGAGGKFDDEQVAYPSVLFDGTTYHMWYGGNDGFNWRIGYATSPDGITWTRQNSGDCVLDLGAGGSWDDTHAFTPVVYKLGKEYYMVYVGYSATPKFQIGVAFCKNGDGTTWQKYSANPVISKSASGWDSTRVLYIGFYWDQGVFYVLYAGWITGGDYQIGITFSGDGQTFVKYDANPIFLASATGTDWDHWKESPCIVRVDETFYMWYAGAQDGQDANGIGLAKIP